MLVPILICYILIVNLLTYFLYWKDKRASIAKDWRVPEHVLLCAGFMGGTPAAWAAQHHLRHKLKKSKFQNRFHMLTAIQIGALVFLPAPILYAL